MDRGKRPNKFVSSRNNKIYMDLKDVIREHTLPFLPAKSLFKAQGVCRDWKLQISTPFFAHNQSLSYQAISGVFCQNPGDAPSFISMDPKSCGVPDPSLKFLPEPVDIRASSNGLICCQGHTGAKAYYICNPVTKQWKKLPNTNADHGRDPAVVLVFEPSLLNFVAEYKLISAFPSVDFDNATEFEIYSSSEGAWKVSGEICFASKELVSRSGVHADGVVYWQAKTHGIVAFDLAKDRSQLIQGYYHHGRNTILGMINGKLCCTYANGNSIMVNVLSNIYSNTMQMHSHARTWEEKARFFIDSSVLGGINYDLVVVLVVCCNVVLFQVGRKILCYDMKTKETKVLCSAAESDVRCVSYVNSLVYI
ncbi:F-box protein [Actinidia chinensis var. chinensis]|uniref:F-box protein n=1 Tax=Actinidia chinensis var. chinensis TaxID=1590841 RepID=A0A2R6R5W7_ACTCC|nr:F-box protein [Actinidia chinensis var. chinensis]